MAGDWKINADERARYESYFQQCGPIQGHLTGEQARDFFIKSNLPGDILRKIWDLADVTSDGRLDKREFAIACCLIASQVQKKGPLPTTLPSSLLSDSGLAMNGVSLPPAPDSINASNPPAMSGQPTGNIMKPAGSTNASIVPLTESIRSKCLQQFHSLVDVAKTGGFMNGSQAKNILVQTGLPNNILHQIWTLADLDKDGRLTADEFVIAMHCCDIARTGQTLPGSVPNEWLPTNTMQSDRSSKSNDIPTYAQLNQQLKETINQTETSAETAEAEKKLMIQTYEEKRQRNYEDGNRELERRRQLLREQEEREQKEREERERKRELELQKQRDEQERKKQQEIERQLEKQRQIEQQKEEERKKLQEQREAARKEMERKNRLEWERQRMQELSNQKSRLSEQINDLKSRRKAFELELESMDDTMQTSQSKIAQIETNIHAIDESIAEIQKNISTERNLVENVEQQKKDLTAQLNAIQTERESLDASVNQLTQSKEFNNGSRELEQIKHLQSQIETMTQENTQIDGDITTITDQCKEYQNQMEQLRLQLDQLEQEAKDKKPPSLPSSQVTTPTNPPPAAVAEFANFDQFNNNTSSNDLNNQTSDPSSSSSLPVVPAADVAAAAAAVTSSSSPTIDVDPFQTVDPFAAQSDIGATTANTDWFQPSDNNQHIPTAVDSFLSKTESTETPPVTASPKLKKAAPKANPNLKSAPKEVPAADPWGAPTNANTSGNNWAQFGATAEWPQTAPVSNETSSTGGNQYRILYDYTGQRPDELSVSAGDIITIDPSKQQDEHWLFGQVGNDKQGFFPAAYAEPITSSTPSTNDIDTTSQLPSGSWAMALAECQGKTPDKHLSFQKGDLIHVREQKDATWYSGQLHGKIGWFPRSYVRPATENEIEQNKSSDQSNIEKPSDAPTSRTHSTEHDIYEAIYPYEAADTSDLSFDIGQRILVLKRDGDWWTGQIGDHTGTFPSNYVQKYEYLQDTVVATTAYQSVEEDQLSFEQGQTIYVTKKDDKGLYYGEIHVPDQPIRVGWFPADCVQIQTVTPSVSSQQPTSEHPQYMAIFPYEAQQEDELSFPADAILEILDHTNPSGWFKARLGDQVGLIPSTYVQPIDAHHQQQ